MGHIESEILEIYLLIIAIRNAHGFHGMTIIIIPSSFFSSNTNQSLSYELHAYQPNHHLIHLLHFLLTVARQQVHISFGRNLQDLGNGAPAKNDWNILNALLG